MRHLIAFALLLATCLPASAQTYPDHTVAVVVPAAPGGPSDALARVLAEKLQEAFGTTVVVENRGGANGTIGVGAVARAAPDGYTVLLSVDGPITTIPALMPKVPYGAMTDLEPVAIVGDGGDVVLAVPADSPAKSVKDLVELLRKNPSKANYVSSGVGFPSHIVGELFKREAGFKAQHLPMRGAGAAMIELLSGRMSFSLPPASLAAVHAKTGKIRVLAVAAQQRNPLLPGVPTFAEAGYAGIAPPGYWIGTYVPTGTPASIVDTLRTEIRQVTQSDAFGQLLKKQGLRASDASPEQIAARVRKETDYWKNAIRELDIVLE